MISTQFVGWFVNGSYSVFLWLPSMPRQLYLGFDANGTEVQCIHQDLPSCRCLDVTQPYEQAWYE